MANYSQLDCPWECQPILMTGILVHIENQWSKQWTKDKRNIMHVADASPFVVSLICKRR